MGGITSRESPVLADHSPKAAPLLRLTTKTRSLGFEKKAVIVVGIGNTAADIAVDLVGTASKVYLSHRRGALMLSRFRQGAPAELGVNYHVMRIMNFMEDTMPSVAAWIQGRFLKSMVDKSWSLTRAGD